MEYEKTNHRGRRGTQRKEWIRHSLSVSVPVGVLCGRFIAIGGQQSGRDVVSHMWTTACEEQAGVKKRVNNGVKSTVNTDVKDAVNEV